MAALQKQKREHVLKCVLTLELSQLILLSICSST